MNSALKIAIIGYGKMGQEIHKLAPGAGCEVTVVIDKPEDWDVKAEQLKMVDVAIEFTAPHVVTDNLKKLLDMGVPVVTGTTGWLHRLDEIKQYCHNSNGSVFYASNFSIGVNLFFALNRYLAKIMLDYPQYNITLEETHHTQKLDAPSGTAITMLDELLQINSRYKGWKLTADNPADDELPVEAYRVEGVTGTHKLSYHSPVDSISIEHVAHNRVGFAQGALTAARWIKDRKGVYTMKDLLNF